MELFSWADYSGGGASQAPPKVARSIDKIEYSSSDDEDDDGLDYATRDFLPQETEACPEEDRSYVFEDRLERAEQIKDEANELMKAQSYKEARLAYRRAYYHVDFDEMQTFDMQEKHLKMISDAKLPILLNLTQAAVKLAEEANATDGQQKAKEILAKSALSYCKEALKIDPGNAKALYRKGLAYEVLGDNEDAHDWLKRAKTAMGEKADSDRGFKVSMKRVAKKAKEEREEAKKVWKGKLPPVEPKTEEDLVPKKSWKQAIIEHWPEFFGIPVIAGALGMAMYRDFSNNGFY